MCSDGAGSGEVRQSEVAESEDVSPPLPPAPPAESGRCSFLVVKNQKSRRCRFTVVPGLDRCGQHPREGCAELLENDSAVGGANRRVPCPLDPSHSVYEKKLRQHLKICTSARDAAFVTQQPFYAKAINLNCSRSSDGNIADALASDSGTYVPVSEATSAVVDDLVERLRVAFLRAVAEVLGPNADAEALLERSVLHDASDVAHAEKHEVQNQALARLVAESCGTCAAGTARAGSARDDVLVEFGCGRGGLAAAVLSMCPGTRCVLVDREPRRHKFENRQEAREEQVLRLRLDIADFDFAAFVGSPLDAKSLPTATSFGDVGLFASSASAAGPGPAERLEELWRSAAALQAPPWPPSRVLACAKHLCGGATDIALRSLARRQAAQAVDTDAGGGASASEGPAAAFGLAVCVATCCHHRCDSATYVNVRFLQRLGLAQNAADFQQLASTAGWAVGGRASERDAEKRRAGMMAKRLLDLGRVSWLQKTFGLEDAKLVSYIDKEVTPENVAIVAGGVCCRSEDAHL
eukprot:TRINITY_DN29620_c0_g4_i2.p1 TRINITY_DN29620_c0_g4~~TRINITY_DN29620_c0_g4_i2.p1  ORF type:complete len:523 (+),score=131.15 TRINITY_DN29620_c0_g4_i2:117-1685(+)